MYKRQDKASITALALSGPTVKKDAYHSPDPTRSPGMSNTVPMATGGGLIPALIGVAIDQGVTASQRSSFEKNVGNLTPKIDKIYASSSHQVLRQKLMTYLRGDQFFSQRLGSPSKSILSVEITSYGLAKSSKKTSQAFPLSYRIVANVKLTNPAGKELFQQVISGESLESVSTASASSQPHLKNRLIPDASAQFVANLNQQMNLKLGRKR